ncbi:hypothetical protein [Streptomyces flavofungini]
MSATLSGVDVGTNALLVRRAREGRRPAIARARLAVAAAQFPSGA